VFLIQEDRDLLTIDRIRGCSTSGMAHSILVEHPFSSCASHTAEIIRTEMLRIDAGDLKTGQIESVDHALKRFADDQNPANISDVSGPCGNDDRFNRRERFGVINRVMKSGDEFVNMGIITA